AGQSQPRKRTQNWIKLGGNVNTVVYDLTNQWISCPGPFRYDIDWLKPSASADTMEEFLRGNFRAAFQLDPKDVQLIA
ncbi:hypothetical protein, partial [Rhabdaerophilum sp. SD176]|uniref:hypothetical protein n=1 Tax=Rhabdaerophilum sp. SD176 TaxID=2983548 RepID=UPI0024DFD1CE